MNIQTDVNSGCEDAKIRLKIDSKQGR